MRASCMSSSSRILRTARRMVLRSSINSTSSRSATASVTLWASLLTLSRLNRTAGASSGVSSVPGLKHGLVFFHQLGLHFTEHFLVIGAALLHLFGICLENDAYLIVDTVFERQLFEQGGVHLLVKSGHRLGLDETARHQFFGNLAGEIAHVFFGKEHNKSAFLGRESLTQASDSLVAGRKKISCRLNPPRQAES